MRQFALIPAAALLIAGFLAACNPRESGGSPGAPGGATGGAAGTGGGAATSPAMPMPMPPASAASH